MYCRSAALGLKFAILGTAAIQGDSQTDEYCASCDIGQTGFYNAQLIHGHAPPDRQHSLRRDIRGADRGQRGGVSVFLHDVAGLHHRTPTCRQSSVWQNSVHLARRFVGLERPGVEQWVSAGSRPLRPRGFALRPDAGDREPRLRSPVAAAAARAAGARRPVQPCHGWGEPWQHCAGPCRAARRIPLHRPLGPLARAAGAPPAGAHDPGGVLHRP